MFDLVSRFQYVANKALTSSMIIASIIACTSFLQLYSDKVWSMNSTVIKDVKPLALVKYSFNYGSVNRKPKENSKISFDLDADLTPLFNFNTKQVFVYLTAEYPGRTENSSNKVTYWDKIITSKDDALISLKNQKSKYSVWDVEKSFRGREAVVRLEWNLQPYIGFLTYGLTNNHETFQFAEIQAPKKEQQRSK